MVRQYSLYRTIRSDLQRCPYEKAFHSYLQPTILFENMAHCVMTTYSPIKMDVLMRVFIPPHPQLPSFLTLPLEIRNTIYDLFTGKGLIPFMTCADIAEETHPSQHQDHSGEYTPIQNVFSQLGKPR
jgi:hypothetical protein